MGWGASGPVAGGLAGGLAGWLWAGRRVDGLVVVVGRNGGQLGGRVGLACRLAVWLGVLAGSGRGVWGVACLPSIAFSPLCSPFRWLPRLVPPAPMYFSILFHVFFLFFSVIYCNLVYSSVF